MKNILKKVILLVLITNMTNCSKEETDHEITEVNPNSIVVYDKISEGGIDVFVEIPAGKTKDDFILIDNKGRNLEINATGKSIIEKNTIVTLVNKETNKPIYIAYFVKENTSAKTTTASKSEKKNENKTTSNTCESILKIGVVSTTKFILASILQPISVFQFGNSENDAFSEVYDTTLLCDVFTEAQTLEIENIVKTLTEEGKDLGEVVLSSLLKNIVQPITGGLFSDCWEILVSSISDRKVKFEAHPYEDYQVSLLSYNKDNRDFPSVLQEFTNAMPNGVIIKDATYIESTDKWNIKLDVYNSLPIPFGIRLGKRDTSTLPVTVNNETNYIIKSNGLSTIEQIKNGAGCQGFVNNIHDTYYTLSSEGVAIRSSDFDKIEVELEFNPTNNYIIFEGPNENIRVKAFHALESLSHVLDAALNLQSSKKELKKNKKAEMYFEIIELVLKNQDAKNLLTSTNTNYKEVLKVVGQVLKKYIEDSLEDGIDTVFNQLRDEKVSTVSTVKIIEKILDVVDLINYGDAWTKIDSYTTLAVDYQLYIPEKEAIPILYTGNITNITHNSAESGCVITNDGRAIIAKKGICWSTEENPTIENTKLENEDDVTSFRTLLTDLIPNTTYYVRAFATNHIGTGYGEQKEFKTDLDPDALSIVSITPTTAVFGEETTFTVNGTSIPEGLWYEAEDIEQLREFNGGKHTERIIKGTPINSIGVKKGVVKRDKNDTKILFEFEITVTSNQNVTTPTLLTPNNGAINIPNNSPSQLSWSESKWVDTSNTETISYDLYFGTNSNPPKHQFIPTGYTSPNSLNTQPNTTYYWKVVARDGQNNELASSEIWSFTTKANGGIYDGDLTINSQNDINEFNYSEVTGYLKIGVGAGSSTDIANLNGLNNLTSVGGDMVIGTGFDYGNDLLTSLIGLENLQSVGGNLVIANNDILTSLNGLNALTTTRGLIIRGNESLNSISDLINLTSVYGDLIIWLNDSLTTLNGLENITILENDIYIGTDSSNNSAPNNSLTNFCSISQLITNGQVTNSEYFVSHNNYNPSYTDIQNIGSGGCKQ
jgi:hypothetical protein